MHPRQAARLPRFHLGMDSRVPMVSCHSCPAGHRHHTGCGHDRPTEAGVRSPLRSGCHVLVTSGEMSVHDLRFPSGYFSPV